MIDVTSGIISKFADDTKAGRTVHGKSDRELLQSEFDKLLEWTVKWQMEFNIGKCKVIHFGRDNPLFSYMMGGFAPGGIVLESVTEEKDVWVIVSANLKPLAQCAKAVEKANSVLDQMSCAFHY